MNATVAPIPFSIQIWHAEGMHLDSIKLKFVDGQCCFQVYLSASGIAS